MPISRDVVFHSCLLLLLKEGWGSLVSPLEKLIEPATLSLSLSLLAYYCLSLYNKEWNAERGITRW